MASRVTDQTRGSAPAGSRSASAMNCDAGATPAWARAQPSWIRFSWSAGSNPSRRWTRGAKADGE